MDSREENKKIVQYKISLIENDIKIMKDTMFDIKIEINEMKKLILDLVKYNHQQSLKQEEKKNYWLYP